MDTEQAREVIDIVVSAELTLDQAKADYKAVTDAAFETYDMTPDQIKAAKATAKAIIKRKLEEVEEQAAELSSMIEVAKIKMAEMAG